MRCALFVGRVGSLAIALGVGMSIAGVVGTAGATTGDTDATWRSDSTRSVSRPAVALSTRPIPSASETRPNGRSHKRDDRRSTATGGIFAPRGGAHRGEAVDEPPAVGTGEPERNTNPIRKRSDRKPKVEESATALDGSGDGAADGQEDSETAGHESGTGDDRDSTHRTTRQAHTSDRRTDIPRAPKLRNRSIDEIDLDRTTATKRRVVVTDTAPVPASVRSIVTMNDASAVATEPQPVSESASSLSQPDPNVGRTKLQRLASNLLDLIAARRTARGGHTAPMESPIMLAMLAWTRRESQQPQPDAASAIEVQPTALSAKRTGTLRERIALRIAAKNSAPVASTPTFGAPDPVTGSLTGSLNVSDPNGDKLTYSVVGAPVGGKVVLNSNGSFVYTPSQATRLRAGASLAPDVDKFTVSVSDGKAAITLTVNAPVYSAQLSSSTISLINSGASPSGIAVHGNRIYVANTAGNSITAIDGPSNTVLATIGVGAAPTSLTVSPDGNTLYVANSGSNTVTAISTVSGAVIANIAVGARPQGVVINSAGSRLYVTNTAGNNVSVVSTSTGATLAQIAVGVAPTGVAVSADGARVYVANRSSGTVSAIDTATNTVVSTMKVGTSPQAIAVSGDGSRLYVTNSDSNTVSVLNPTTGATVATIVVGSKPYGVAISRDGSLVYVANSDATVSVIDAKTATKLTGTLRTETGTGSMIAMSADGTRVYVTNTAGTTIRVTNLVHAADPPPSNVVSPSQLDSTGFLDDFTGAAGTRPSSSIWGYHLGAGGDSGQLEAFTDSIKNASLDGAGNLVITAIKEPIQVPGYGTFDYSSAFLTTQGKVDFTYGTIAARIQMPVEQGLTSAFWTLGSDIQTLGWPTGGELDIVELANDGVYSGSTLHGPGGYALPVQTPVDITTGYHTFWMRWEPNRIVTGVDETTMAVYTPDSLAPGTPWTFNDRSMFAILSLHVGGPYGAPDNSTSLPASMLVDWVSYTPLTAVT